MAAAIVDGAISRVIKSMEFLHHDPERCEYPVARAQHEDDLDGEYQPSHGMRAHEASRPSQASAMNARSSRSDDSSSVALAADMRSPLSRGMAKVTPALENWAKRAKTTIALLAARASKRRGGAGDDVEIPIRRTTAPAPGGGLHTAGRKVIRGEIDDRKTEEPRAKRPVAMTKKKMFVLGGVGVATILAFVALRKPDAPAPVAAAPVTETAPAAAPAPPPAPAPAPTTAAMPAANDPFASMASGGASDPMTNAKPGKVTPFGNGPVNHGNVLKIKMDGPVARIQGASQPSGFTVVIPGRKSLDAAGPLAAKDSRIAAIRVANENSGAELTVTFKDGVPNYQVKARGDVLELHLAKAGRAGDKAPEAHAKPRHKKKH